MAVLGSGRFEHFECAARSGCYGSVSKCDLCMRPAWDALSLAVPTVPEMFEPERTAFER